MVQSSIYICSEPYYIRFCMYMMPSTFVYGSLCMPICISMWSQWRYCVSLNVAAVILSICLPLLVWPSNFQEKSDRGNINHVVFMSITIILPKLLLIIWCYVISLALCQSVWIFFCILSNDIYFKSLSYYFTYASRGVRQAKRMFVYWFWGCKFRASKFKKRKTTTINRSTNNCNESNAVLIHTQSHSVSLKKANHNVK